MDRAGPSRARAGFDFLPISRYVHSPSAGHTVGETTLVMKRPLILYVDDDPEALRVLKIGLEDRGFIVLTALGGKEAYAILETEKPDLIITDLRMTPVNGFDLFVELKKTPKFSDTPFVFLTAVDDQLAQTYGKKLGVDAYLTKPVDIDRLEAIVVSRAMKAL